MNLLGTWRTAAVGLLVASLSVLAAASPAAAAPPVNDDVNTATVVSGLPYTDTVDTTEATAAEGDSCGSATVWYQFTPTEDAAVLFRAYGTDDATLGVYTGTPGDLSLMRCFASFITQLVLDVEAGTTYYIEVGNCCGGVPAPGTVGPGGTMTFTAEIAAPAVTKVDLTVDRVATVTKDGVVTASGTVACDQRATVRLQAIITQRRPRSFAGGESEETLPCGPTPTEWTLGMASDTGTRFVAGKATMFVSALASNEQGSASTSVEDQPLRLRPAK